MYQRKNKFMRNLPTILGWGVALYLTGVGVYQIACTPKSRIMARRLESELAPLREDFTRIVEGDENQSAEPFSIERVQGFDESKVMDYGERLTRIIAQRDSVLAEHGCEWQGSWMSRSHSANDAYAEFKGRVLHTNPFRSLEDIN